jgi:hypothetical protein
VTVHLNGAKEVVTSAVTTTSPKKKKTVIIILQNIKYILKDNFNNRTFNETVQKYPGFRQLGME